MKLIKFYFEKETIEIFVVIDNFNSSSVAIEDIIDAVSSYVEYTNYIGLDRGSLGVEKCVKDVLNSFSLSYHIVDITTIVI